MEKKSQVLTPEERVVVAYHKAGHALLADSWSTQTPSDHESERKYVPHGHRLTRGVAMKLTTPTLTRQFWKEVDVCMCVCVCMCDCFHLLQVSIVPRTNS